MGPDCPPLPVSTQLFLPYGFTLSPDGFSNNSVIKLSTNKSVTLSPLINLRENILPKAYTLAVEASVANFELGTPSRAEGTFTMRCPIPEAPSNVDFEQASSVFSKNRVMLTWNACENELFCCCPCTWMVYRNGKYIGTSKERSFTDNFNLDDGVGYNYSVVTVDVNGARSPPDTCKNAVLVTGESADITTYVIILACVVVFVLTVTTSIVVILVYLNWEKIDSKLKIWKINTLQKLFVFRRNH